MFDFDLFMYATISKCDWKLLYFCFLFYKVDYLLACKVKVILWVLLPI